MDLPRNGPKAMPGHVKLLCAPYTPPPHKKKPLCYSFINTVDSEPARLSTTATLNIVMMRGFAGPA